MYRPCVGLLVSHRVPTQAANGGKIASYGGYVVNNISWADQNKSCSLAVFIWSCKGQTQKISKVNHLVLQGGGYANGRLPTHRKQRVAKTLNVSKYPDGLKVADESVDKGILIANCT